MSVDERLGELLLIWEERHEQGRPLAPEALCHDCPELLPELKRRIGALQALHAVLDTTDDAPPPTRDGANGMADDLEPARPPPSVDGYEIFSELGRGGMGVVYKARQLKLGRVVALKMVLAGAHAGREQLLRFRIEAEAIARLQHPNIVQIYEIGEQDGHPYIALEYVDGHNLDRELCGERQPLERATQLIETLARAMHVAHQRGIVHRDLKPANVLLTKDGTPKITDFGLAKRLDDNSRQTRSGVVMGTPSYMAPEQAAGRTDDIGPATDVYALGAMLYEMLTGNPPFDSPSTYDVLNRVLTEEPRPPIELRREVPRDLQTICLKCLAKEPGKRYASAEALADDLRRFLHGEPIQARPVGPVERFAKWARRRPTAAALLGVSLVAAVVVLGGGWVTAIQLNRANQIANDEIAKSNQSLINLHVVDGARALDEGDLFGSLVWFARALSLEKNAERQGPHRTRLRAVLQQCPRLKQMWFHDRGVNDVVVSPNGKRVATAGDDYTARIWDAATGASVCPPLEHQRPVYRVAFSPDGRWLATASQDGTAQIWDAVTGAALLNPVPRHEGPVLDVCFRPDGKEIVTASEDHTARRWNAVTGQAVGPRLEHKGSVLTASYDRDGSRVLTASADGTAQVWDGGNGKALLDPPPRHEGPVVDARFRPDGLRFVTASDDKTARVWETATGKPVTEPFRHHGPVASAAFSPDGARVVTASADLSARVWDAATGKPMTPALRHDSAVKRASFNGDGTRIVTASADHSARVWDVDTGRPSTPPLTHNGTVQAAVFSPDGQWVATASDDNSARVYGVAPGGPFVAPLKHDGPVLWAAFAPDGKRVATASADKIAQIWNAATGTKAGPALRHDGPVVQVTFDSQGGRVLTASVDKTAQVWDAASGEASGAALRHDGPVNTAEFSPDGRRVATASDDKTARLWDAATGKLLATMRHDGAVLDVAFSPDGTRVVTASADDTAQIWDAATGKPVLAQPLRHQREVLQAEFSPDGQRVVTAGTDNLAHVWDAHLGTKIGTPLRHAGPVRDVSFGPGGQRVVTASDDSTGRVWDLATDKLLPPLWHRGPVAHARFSPDGRRVVTASDDNTGRVWSADTGEPLSPRLTHSGWGRITFAAFGKDGQHVVTASDDGTARLWDFRRIEWPVATIEQLAQLLAGSRIDPAGTGSLVPLEAETMKELWGKLRPAMAAGWDDGR